MMATLWNPPYRNVMDSVNWETQVSVSRLYHTEVHVWEAGNYTPLLLLRHLHSEEKMKISWLLPCCQDCSLCKHSNRQVLLKISAVSPEYWLTPLMAVGRELSGLGKGEEWVRKKKIYLETQPWTKTSLIFEVFLWDVRHLNNIPSGVFFYKFVWIRCENRFVCCTLKGL